jgi:hypothetical protein
MLRRMRAQLLCLLVVCACGGSSAGPDGGGGDDDGAVAPDADPAICRDVDCSGHGTCVAVNDQPLCDCDGGYMRTDATTCEVAVGPTLAGCPLFPADNLFNTQIDALPVHPDSDAFIATIGGGTNVHLDLGTTTDQQAKDFYGIPYNVVHGDTFTWPTVHFLSTDPDLDWSPEEESDCAVGTTHTFTQPCTVSTPLLPIPPSGVIVEGGIDSSSDQQPYGDHHILMVDADTCWLWETYHSYSPSAGTWNIYGSAGWDLTSNALRPDMWSSADAAGFPILPLLLRPDEAATGAIHHALRFTINSDKIRIGYVWPARHLTSNGTESTDLPPMGQLFRLKASYVIPGDVSTQSRAILEAMKTYGVYLADGGSDMYVTGAPGAWDDSVFSDVQALEANDFEAVDLGPIMDRPGFDPDSGAVP